MVLLGKKGIIDEGCDNGYGRGEAVDPNGNLALGASEPRGD
jgi:hypothetical protein